MARVDSSAIRLLTYWCSRYFAIVAVVVLLMIAFGEFITLTEIHSQRNDSSPTEMELTEKFSSFTEIAEDVYLVHTIRDRRNRGEEIRALVYAKAPNYNVECGMKDGVRLRASWYEMSDNGNSLWRAFYLTCNLPNFFIEGSIEKSICFVEHSPNEEAPRFGMRNTGVDIDYDLSLLDPPEFAIFFGLCVPLLASGRFSGEDIVEFVEINRKLGVDRITFMTSPETLSQEISAALDHYRNYPLVDLVNFSLNLPSGEIENGGENVARDICLHRHAQTTDEFYHFRFLGFTTLREFFLPLANATMAAILRESPYYESGLIKISALNVQITNDTHPLTLSNKSRMERLDHSATRGIVRPRKVVEMGTHFAYQLVDSGRKIVIENNGNHIVVYRLTGATSESEDATADRLITDLVPALGEVYHVISKNTHRIQQEMHSTSKE